MISTCKWIAASTLLAFLSASASTGAEQATPATTAKSQQRPRSARLALFELPADKQLSISSAALTDRVLAICAGVPNIVMVDRDELQRVAAEQKVSLSGMTDAGAGVRLGRMVAATHIVVGRLSKVGPSKYLILKLVDVETTVQQVISLRGRAGESLETMLESLPKEIERVLAAPSPVSGGPGTCDDLKSAVNWLSGATVIISLREEHISRPLADPACAMVAFSMLQELGINVVLPNSPPVGWQEAVRAEGVYEDTKIDYLLEGEGVSSFAAELQGLTSCRARVELRLVPVPGREVLDVKRGVGAEVDLVEALAAKAALEEATREALCTLIHSVNSRIGGK